MMARFTLFYDVLLSLCAYCQGHGDKAAKMCHFPRHLQGFCPHQQTVPQSFNDATAKAKRVSTPLALLHAVVDASISLEEVSLHGGAVIVSLNPNRRRSVGQLLFLFCLPFACTSALADRGRRRFANIVVEAESNEAVLTRDIASLKWRAIVEHKDDATGHHGRIQQDEAEIVVVVALP